MQANGIASAVLFSCLLITASVWDVKKRIIPDTLCLLMALVGLLSLSPTKLFGIFIALPLFIAAICKDGSVGGGDIKLTAAIGIVTGFPVGIFGLILSLTASIAFYLVNQMVRKLRGLPPLTAKQIALPMAPFLCFGFLTAYFMNIGGLLS